MALSVLKRSRLVCSGCLRCSPSRLAVLVVKFRAPRLVAPLLRHLFPICSVLHDHHHRTPTPRPGCTLVRLRLLLRLNAVELVLLLLQPVVVGLQRRPVLPIPQLPNAHRDLTPRAPPLHSSPTSPPRSCRFGLVKLSHCCFALPGTPLLTLRPSHCSVFHAP